MQFAIRIIIKLPQFTLRNQHHQAHVTGASFGNKLKCADFALFAMQNGHALSGVTTTAELIIALKKTFIYVKLVSLCKS